MPTTIITICSNRKRAPIPDGLRAATLPAGTTAAVAAAWADQLEQSPRVAPAREVYCGRAFREAEAAAAACDAGLHVISAGLGLISADAAIPAYGLTLSSGQADGVLGKVDGDASAWWVALTARSPFHSAVPDDGGLILAALPAPYLAMVAAEWSAWPEERLKRLRLFSVERPQGAAARLADVWMPYGQRLQDPKSGRKGTDTDSAQRALRHFVEMIGAAGRSASALAPALDGQLMSPAKPGPILRRCRPSGTAPVRLRASSIRPAGPAYRARLTLVRVSRHHRRTAVWAWDQGLSDPAKPYRHPSAGRYPHSRVQRHQRSAS